MPEAAQSGPTGSPILDLAIVLALILVGGFFAASEIALITVKRHRLNQLVGEGSRAARVAQRLTEDPSRFLATIQIAITFLGFLASAVGAVALSGSLASLVRLIPFEPIRNAAGEISFVLVTLLIALASIIVGELVPKTLALSFPDRFAIFVARPIGWFDRLLRPIVWLVSTISNVVRVTTSPGGPLLGKSGAALAVGRRPSGLPVQLYWQVPEGTARGVAGGEITLFDLTGRRLRRFPCRAGAFGGIVTWDGRDERGASVPAGLYFARLISGSLHFQTRVVLLQTLQGLSKA